jgi:hypothetical protein
MLLQTSADHRLSQCLTQSDLICAACIRTLYSSREAFLPESFSQKVVWEDVLYSHPVHEAVFLLPHSILQRDSCWICLHLAVSGLGRMGKDKTVVEKALSQAPSPSRADRKSIHFTSCCQGATAFGCLPADRVLGVVIAPGTPHAFPSTSL